MQFLQTAYRPLGSEFDRATEGFAPRQRGCVGYLVLQRRLANLRRVCNGLATLGSVDDQLNLAVLDGINNVRTAFAHLVHPVNLEARIADHLCRAGGGNETET